MDSGTIETAAAPAGRSSPFGRFERSLAWRYLRARRKDGGASLIAIISFTGIALAVTALIVTMSIMGGFRATLVKSLVGGKGHVLIGVGQYPQDEVLALLDDLEAIDGIVSATPIVEGQVLAQGQRDTSGALVRGIRKDDLDVYPSLVDDAEASGFGEGRKGGNKILVGKYLAEKLFFSPVGSDVTLISSASTPTVVGGTQARRKAYRAGATFQTGSVELDQIYIIMPLEQAQLFLGKKGRIDAIDIRLDDFEKTEEAIERLREILGQGIFITDWKSQNATYLGALQTERSVMRIILLVLITITSLNIITGVIMLVKNKARDIAILRTIGASRSAMMRVFMMIGASLGIAGALAGFAIGSAMIINISAIENGINLLIDGKVFPAEIYGLEGLPAELDLQEAIMTTAWAIMMSILVTIPPAWIAAKTDPVDALRFEQ